MSGTSAADGLVGKWSSTSAFGNLSLDWANEVKSGTATLHLDFGADGTLTFCVRDAQEQETTNAFKHTPPSNSRYTVAEKAGRDVIEIKDGYNADVLEWSFQFDGEGELHLRLEGKAWFRCRGVDNIFMRRIGESD